MTKEKTAAIVLAAGLGTRMKSSLPKVMHRVAGRPMVQHLLATVETLSPDKIVAVIGPDMDDLAAAVAPHPTAVQTDRLGTGHAVLAAKEALDGFEGDVLIMFGDSPLLTAETMTRMLAARRDHPGTAVAVLGFRTDDPGAYGRLVTGSHGRLEAIVEAKDASDEQLKINLCNSGLMCVSGKHLFRLLGQVTNDNAKGEFYLTDIVAIAHAEGLDCVVAEGDEEELLGVNSRVELAQAERLVQQKMRNAALAAGVTMIEPDTVWFNWDTQIGQDVTLQPNVFFGPGVTVGDGVTVKAFSHLEGCSIGAKAQVGPFARLRPGAKIGEQAKVGNFVEIKNADVEQGAKVSHLTYIGDARIGADANIGAGTITCNYDGYLKHKTDIGAGAFIGSNSALVAPVTIGDGAIIGAGSVVARDVAADALAVTRAEHREIKDWAPPFRERKAAEKAARKKK
ncbi:bifunctional UDP-N-acetylglucosamine diphosphorylase/glucosamine-1-phosphate N-acetyltransferase GlmU [Magnetospira sp. QH-2]|uniref:bifunctional UDP-N-acetylglucosamine diphosphorylase/glucosamine-1-phosphate N-acetyltransferase GlmU n=1 Tax=Magnetospira sp. (strain QH-2) TaxID=1288970 RepID=UPI0003E80DF1|nr:bifunctional UDP-N-acetylglucosamine diphosphorylase/glucosamine-1-phosphate N-acetyltransferase GlmU [Magnetospira sp. QH-2]CCQ72756.1 bifunctional: N-acetyl glucosamine-1-phosphate uridyltransferase (N-terminal); glucosamine-1-phosphate acetyl transferase (C-terminal) [Magnetospira sp. QH-2]